MERLLAVTGFTAELNLFKLNRSSILEEHADVKRIQLVLRGHVNGVKRLF